MRISGLNVASWAGEMSRLAARFSESFESTNGYPPGDNFVIKQTEQSDRDSLMEALGGPQSGDLVEFYTYVAEISFEDVGPGFFVHRAEDVVAGMRDYQPTRLISASQRQIAVFGSDGGGALFAADRHTGEVVRLEGGAFVGIDYEVEECSVQVIAANLAGFLQFLHQRLLQQIVSES
ncbi:hypothetical protein FFT09_02445 [Saccharomonospora piscinae]|uniref:hypothetical protein n=1 Tax=Saccharomonospora piscinae TaxID=687388 RepID=UPI001106704D|nr:hypothetical protein [Saccharomonospora piscinae]TLW94755.1 hypothetical protein FFT09_02445 [Saccharomonospora piscinae]